MTEHHNAVVIGGLGQGREGKGHDAFADVPYDMLNAIKILDVKMSDSGVSLVADLAAAYEPSVGVTQFTRRFNFKVPGEFLIEDSIKTDRPQRITSYLHSDNSIVEEGSGFKFEGGDLLAEIIEPTSYNRVIGPNFLTAPGRPGSVDKGDREQRGVRLAISPKEARTDTSVKVRLRIRP
jgi:hypothetical protein